jgi:hypothetical protein
MCLGGRREKSECRERIEYTPTKGLEIGIGMDFVK